MKRILLMLCLFMVIVFTGCGEQGNQPDNTPVSSSDEVVESSQIMAADHEEVTEDYGAFQNMTLVGETLYYSTLDWDADKRQGTWEIYRKKENEEASLITKGEGQELLIYTSDRDGNLYLIYQEENAAQDEEGDATQGTEGKNIYFKKLNMNGEEVFTSVADWLLSVPVNDYICNLEITPQGQACALTTNGILFLLNEKGEEIGSISTDWAEDNVLSGHMGLTNGGSYGIYGYLCEKGRVSFSRIDFETCRTEEPFVILLDDQAAALSFYERAVWVYSNYEKGILLADNKCMMRYNFETEEVEELFDWEDAHINLSPDFVEQAREDEDGGYTLLTYDVHTNISSQVHIEQRDKSELPEKITITLGGFIRDLNDTLEEQIGRFNRSQEEYCLEVVRYNSPNHLNFMLLKDEGPDIIFLQSLSIEQLSAKGVLEDLTPYIDNSPSLSGNILESIQRVCTLDGGIRYLFPYFSLNVLILEQGHTDENGVIAPMDYLHLTDNRKDSYLLNASNSLRYDSLLTTLLTTEINSYIDWENKVCHFDDGRFEALLEAIKAQKMPTGEYGEMPESDLPEVQRFVNGEYLSKRDYISNMYKYINLQDAFGECGEITGFPNSDGVLQYPVNTVLCLGVNSASDQKQGAWEFMEYLLLNTVDVDSDFAYIESFSVVEDLFIKQLSPQPKENTRYDFTNSYTGEQLKGVENGDFFTVTEEQKMAVMEMVDNASGPMWGYDTVQGIIWEETKYFFEGDKSAKEICDIIQNRISIMLME